MCITRKVVWAVAGLAALSLTMSASAASIDLDGSTIRIRGTIEDGDTTRLRSQLMRNDHLDVDTVSLDSGGGLLREGIPMANFIRTHHMNTIVSDNAECASACFLLFAAGVHRSIGRNTHIGVHSARVPGVVGMDDGDGTMIMARYAAQLGVPPVILGRMIETTSGSMAWLESGDLDAMGVTVTPPLALPYRPSEPKVSKPKVDQLATLVQMLPKSTPEQSLQPIRPSRDQNLTSQRAAFLIDAPDDPQKVKTYLGTVVWRKVSINPGQGQPLIQAVHADVDIPDVALKLTMVLQKNLDAQFPASHTLDLRFTTDRSGPFGGVRQINVPQMRKDDSPKGDSLVGLPVTITENYFLVGLSRGEASARDIEQIENRNWFDIPMLMTSGKVAKITFEKGIAGQHVIDDVVGGSPVEAASAAQPKLP